MLRRDRWRCAKKGSSTKGDKGGNRYQNVGHIGVSSGGTFTMENLSSCFSSMGRSPKRDREIKGNTTCISAPCSCSKLGAKVRGGVEIIGCKSRKDSRYSALGGPGWVWKKLGRPFRRGSKVFVIDHQGPWLSS